MMPGGMQPTRINGLLFAVVCQIPMPANISGSHAMKQVKQVLHVGDFEHSGKI
jgi:hypothetical protein